MKRKLTIRKETLRTLIDRNLEQAAGGGWTKSPCTGTCICPPPSTYNCTGAPKTTQPTAPSPTETQPR